MRISSCIISAACRKILNIFGRESNQSKDLKKNSTRISRYIVTPGWLCMKLWAARDERICSSPRESIEECGSDSKVISSIHTPPVAGFSAGKGRTPIGNQSIARLRHSPVGEGSGFPSTSQIITSPKSDWRISPSILSRSPTTTQFNCFRSKYC